MWVMPGKSKITEKQNYSKGTIFEAKVLVKLVKTWLLKQVLEDCTDSETLMPNNLIGSFGAASTILLTKKL